MTPRKTIQTKLLNLGCTDIVLTYRNQWFYTDGCVRWEAIFNYRGTTVEVDGLGDDSMSAAESLIKNVSCDIESGFIS